MKVGVRKPNVKKSIKARTTGKMKRAVKRSVNPVYGKKGVGFVKDPERAVKNAVYHRSTVGVGEIINNSTANTEQHTDEALEEIQGAPTGIYTFLMIICIAFVIMGLLLTIVMPVVGLLAVVGGIVGAGWAHRQLKSIKLLENE